MKYCSLHGSGSHSSKECRAIKAKDADAPPTPILKPISPPGLKAPEQKQPVTCFKCGKPGHYANKCHSSEKRQVSFSFLEGLPTDAPPPLPFEVSFEGLETSLPSSAISFPLTLNDVKVSAHLDTGASSSFLAPSVLATLNAVAHPTDTSVLLGHRESTVASTEAVTVSVNQDFTHTFLVLDVRHDCIFGRDLMAKLNIGLTNLPTPVLSTPLPLPIPDAPPPLPEQSFFSNEAEADHFGKSIQPSLDRNAAIPKDSVCPVTNAEVRLPVPVEKAKFMRQYRIPEVYKPLVDQQVDRWKAKHVVVPAPPGCKFNNPLTTAPKKDPNTGQVDPKVRRICLDPRAFNAELPDDHFSLPLIEDIFASLSGAIIFSSLDIEDAYPRLPIHPDDRQVTAFMHRGEHLMFARAIYGIKHMSSHFQRVVSHLLTGMSKFCLVFIDDIIVFSLSVEDHISHVRRVIECLTDALLPLKLIKCHFGMKRLFLLGNMISHNQISIDHRKLANVDAWKPPASAKEVERFLGFTNYFRKFVPNYSSVAAPLERVRKCFSWSSDQQHAWESFKLLLTHAPVLTLPNFTLPFEVHTDASDTGIGAVLLQRDAGSGSVAYIGFLGRALQPTEANYSATKKELLAIIFALTRWRHFLLGQNFTLFTDHKALTALFTSDKLSSMCSNWLDIILEFSNFKIVHLPGIANVLPDYISRVFQGGEDASSPSTSTPTSLASPAELFSIQTADRLLRSEVPVAERKTVLESAHQLGHFGATAIVKHIWAKALTWPGIRNDAVTLVSACRPCQRFNFSKTGFHPMTQLKAELPMDHVCVDLAGPLPTTPSGNNYLLIAVDVCTRFAFLRPIPSKTAASVAMVLLDIFANFGFPRVLSSDNGREFVNSIIDEFAKATGFATRTTSAYHPRGNGLAERFVQTSLQTVKKMVQGHLAQWDFFVPMAQFFINSKISEHHQSTPFAIMFAMAPSLFCDHTNVAIGSLSPQQLEDRRT